MLIHMHMSLLGKLNTCTCIEHTSRVLSRSQLYNDCTTETLITTRDLPTTPRVLALCDTFAEPRSSDTPDRRSALVCAVRTAMFAYWSGGGGSGQWAARLRPGSCLPRSSRALVAPSGSEREPTRARASLHTIVISRDQVRTSACR